MYFHHDYHIHHDPDMSPGLPVPAGVTTTSYVPSVDGTALSVSELRVRLTRYDLTSSFECQSANRALLNPLRARVYVLLHGMSRGARLSHSKILE